MDGSDGNLVKWDGKYGSIFAPINERKRGRGPFSACSDMGKPVATMCLGKCAIVSS
ncbi:hypothetical protein ACS0TY_032672 [Phlomoides rotata]